MKRSNRTGRKILISAAVLGAAAAVAGLGTFGTFTSTTSASATAASGTVVIGLGTAGTADNRLTVASGLLVPGDTIQRQVKLNNTGNQALSGVTLTTTATATSLLDTDTTNGLQLTVQSCPAGWTEAGVAPAYTYTCTGGATTVIASRPVIGANVALTGTTALPSGSSDNLMVKLSFPAAADNTFQAKTSTISFAFTGTQRVATDR